ncbi:MAG: DNA adenine methylase [Hyphomonadaceae bacterium]|nr:DNA adenine methylase [Hyphomonadaceae bacterium]
MTLADAPTRPVLRYHGGKWKLAPWTLAHFPPHRVYVEPFGGAASVLLRKERSYAEVYNELDGEVVNLFRVLRNRTQAPELIEQLRLTPFSRDEFLAAYEEAEEPVERARRLVIRAFMGHGSDSASGVVSGFRANSNRSGTTPAHDWVNYAEALQFTIERLRGVIIENRDAKACMAQHDGPKTLVYLDPPYVHETRTWMTSGRGRGNYRHEMTTEEHAELLREARNLEAMVLIAGYPTELYDEALSDWRRVETLAHADGARPRTEVLWINPQACAALDRLHLPLFARPNCSAQEKAE